MAMLDYRRVLSLTQDLCKDTFRIFCCTSVLIVYSNYSLAVVFQLPFPLPAWMSQEVSKRLVNEL